LKPATPRRSLESKSDSHTGIFAEAANLLGCKFSSLFGLRFSSI
jgi:hypothetical protein